MTDPKDNPESAEQMPETARSGADNPGRTTSAPADPKAAAEALEAFGKKHIAVLRGRIGDILSDRLDEEIALLRAQAAASPEPIAWGCFYPGGMLNVDLVGTQADCQFWAESEDRQAQWIVRPLYDNTERIALLEGLLTDLISEAEFPLSNIDLPRSMIERIRAALGEG